MFSLDALHAGYSPARIEIPMGKRSENVMRSGDMTGVNPEDEGLPIIGALIPMLENPPDSKNDRSDPVMVPRIPPTIPVKLASARNIVSMFLALYPIAFNMPISLVRSIIDTNIVFVIPTPATKRETAAIPPMKKVS